MNYYVKVSFILTATAAYLPFHSTEDSRSENFTMQPKSEPYYVKEHDLNTLLPCVVNIKFAQEPYVMNWIKIVNNSPRILTTGLTNRALDSYELETASCSGCYNLRIKTVSYERDNGRFFCQINGPNNFDLNSRAAEVVVLVKPGSPLISSQPVTPIREGSSGRVDCQSAGGNPPPKIRWYFANGTEVTQYARQSNATDLNSPTTSSLQWTVSATENQARISCRVWNEAMGENSQPLEVNTTPLSVLYPPRVSVGPVNVYNVELGAPANLYCSAEANPPPVRFAWYLNGNVVHSGTNFTIPTTLKTSAGNYTCTANSDDSSGQETLTLNVLYAPEITTSSEYRGAVGKKASLVCTVDANPPPTSVSWTGPNGRSSDGSLLEIQSVSLKDMGNYTCTAKNMLNVYLTGSVPRSSTKTTTVIVDHPPGKAILSTIEPIVAGSTANISCTADDIGSPVAQFRWKAPGQQEFEHASRSTYTIYDIQMNHAGVYSCLPWNNVGNGEVGTYKLIVYEPARLDQFLKTDDVKNESDTGYYLSCSATGNPAPNITWYKDGERIEDNDHWSSTVSKELPTCDQPERCSSKVVGILQWKNGIKWSDKGVFTCEAYNGAGQRSLSTMNMKVYHKPVVINDPNRPYVAADVGKSVEIECKSSAKPEPRFEWYKDNKNLNLTVGGSSLYSIADQRNESFDIFESILTIKRVQETDLGDYSCKAINSLGDHSFKFTLQTKTKPMPAENVRAISQTHRSILLSWTPGFDGGSPQTFTVEVVYPGGVPPRTFPASDTNFARYKRHVGIEKANPVTLNVSQDLYPSNEYKFRVLSKNDLGQTDWTPYASVWTDDAPLNLSIQKPTQGMYNSDSSSVDFKPNSLDSQLYCLLIYRKDNSNGKFVAHSCVDPTVKADGVPSSTNFKIRFCYKQTLTCGEDYEVMVGGMQAAISWEIIVAIVAAIVFVLIVPIVVCLCCRRCRLCNRFKAEKKKQLPKLSNLRKDYEMETNNARPKTISGPFLTEKTPGPSSGLSSVDQNTGSSKDSGVFTTGSNYQYDPNAYIDHEAGTNMYTPHVNGVVMGGGVVRLPSYDDQEHWGVSDGYGLNNSYMHNGDYPDGGDVNRGFESGGYYDPNSGYPDPYIGHSVDMNPNPNSNGVGHHNDGSLNSAYSTPSQRRVIREIIV